MLIPTFDTFMLPILRLTGDGHIHRIPDLCQRAADEFDLTDDQRQELIPSGKQTVLYNRVTWSLTYLKNAGLLERPKRGHFQITDRGRSVLADPPPKITKQYLKQFEGFDEFIAPAPSTGGTEPVVETEDDQTPLERINSGVAEMHKALVKQVRETVAEQSWVFFEQLVVDVLIAMGYGNLRESGAQVTRKSGDEGIDGIINQDPLGLEKVYVQAKRWQGTVGRPVVQAFAGSLEGARASKGVIITTSSFAHTAAEYVQAIHKSIVLIDGEQLAKLMIEHSVGVSTEQVIALKRLDIDYFENEL